MTSEKLKIVAVPEQISADLGEEAVILHLKSGVYYGLNEVGEKIWTLIQEPKTFPEIKAALLAEYDVEPEQCEQDLKALLQDLVKQELIEIKNEASAELV